MPIYFTNRNIKFILYKNSKNEKLKVQIRVLYLEEYFNYYLFFTSLIVEILRLELSTKTFQSCIVKNLRCYRSF